MKPNDVGTCSNCKWATPVKDRIEESTFPPESRGKLEKVVRQFPQHRWECHGSPATYVPIPTNSPAGLAPRAQQLPFIFQPEIRMTRDCDWCSFWEKRPAGSGANGEHGD